MKKVSLLTALLLTACVTINIYFPAAAADKVADEIIKGIQEDKVHTQEPKARLKQAPIVYRWLDNVLAVVFTSAHAAEADLDVDTTEIRKIRASMKSRFKKLSPFYEQGVIGVNRDGLVGIVNAKKVALKDRNSLKKLIAAENSARDQLYVAIANANGHPDWRSQIENTFDKHWLSNVKSGWMYQNSKGQWQQK